uniref:HTH CENPB-type domain-containing protein n=1 Tax=Branchiostoma floridae TaxID=7739 RepID=C3YGR6_BRAFL|eukprot:XP_002604565.1 hypothetical protein BRAFLDRAFT_122350 [Branchiostoma floridae]
MASKPKKTPKKTLTLGEKIEVIKRYERGGIGARTLAGQYGVGKTQIQNIVNRKREYLDDFENNAPVNKRRKLRHTGNEEINKLCWEFYCDTTSRIVTCSGPMLQEQALKFANDLGVTEFKASNGWLESFKKRHNLGLSTMRLVLERHAGKLGGVSNGAAEDYEEPSVSEDSGLGSAPSTAGSAEVKKLKDLLQQRDNEISILRMALTFCGSTINILVNMLKKEKKRAQDAALMLEERGIPFSTGEGTQPNGPGRPPSSRSRHRNREERSRESVSVSRSLSQPDSREKETTPPYSQSTTVRLRKIGGEMSVGRQEAFEIFKRDYEHSVTVDDQKGLLKQRYAEAKQLGEKVNSSRVQINHVKGLIQQHRMARAAQGISDDVGFSEEPDEEEQHLRQQMEDEKASYKVTFNRLRVLKTEIEHLQHLLEKARLQMQKDFELWWAEQTVNAHTPKPPQEPPAAWKTPPISPINPQQPSSRKMAANFSMHPTQDPGPSHLHQGGSRRRHGSFTDNPAADGDSLRASHSYHGNLDAVGLGHHGDRRLSSHSDSSGSHGRVPRHREVLEDSRLAAPAIPLTGDARADADIMAFFKARQKILQQQAMLTMYRVYV